MNIDYNTNTLSSDTEKAASPPRRRRALRSPNRPKVLAAARERFATQGYAGTTIAQIAGDAGVDQALVIRLFGSKIDLFDACLEIPEGMVERFRAALKAPPSGAGRAYNKSLVFSLGRSIQRSPIEGNVPVGSY